MGHPAPSLIGNHMITAIDLPAGHDVDETPDPVDIDTGFASYHSVATAKANQLHFEREYVVRHVEAPAAEATDFRKLESAILADERGAAVLKKQSQRENRGNARQTSGRWDASIQAARCGGSWRDKRTLV